MANEIRISVLLSLLDGPATLRELERRVMRYFPEVLERARLPGPHLFRITSHVRRPVQHLVEVGMVEANPSTNPLGGTGPTTYRLKDEVAKRLQATLQEIKERRMS